MRVFVLLLMTAVAVIGLSVGYSSITGRSVTSLIGSGMAGRAGETPLDASGPGSVSLDPSAAGAAATEVPSSPTPFSSSIPVLPAAGATIVPPTPVVTIVPPTTVATIVPPTTVATIVPPTTVATPIPFLPMAGATATPLPATPTPDPNFKPWWVQSLRETELWSGTDNRAVSFGTVPPSSYFLVVEPQQGPRLHVFNPSNQNYAYIDASAVAPSPAPPGAANPPGAGH